MKKIVAVDTNLLLDFRLSREPGFEVAQEIFKDCSEGKLQIYIPEIVFAELEWVLRSVYKQSKLSIIEFLEVLIEGKNIIFRNTKRVIETVDFFKNTNLKFSDCLIMAEVLEFEPDEFITSDYELQKVYQRLI